jgi:hypothetical protein
MRNYLAAGLIVAFVALLVASYPVAQGQTAGTAAPVDPNVGMAKKVVAMLDNCCACHKHGWEAAGKPKVTWGQDVPRLLKEKWVVAGKPEESRTYQKIRDGKHPGSAAARPSADDIKGFAQWITNGCLDPVTHATSQPASAPAHAAADTTDTTKPPAPPLNNAALNAAAITTVRPVINAGGGTGGTGGNTGGNTAGSTAGHSSGGSTVGHTGGATPVHTGGGNTGH